MAKPDTDHSSPTAQVGLIAIEVTLTMEREFIRRGMFPELRASNAARLHGAAGVYFVSTARAAEILADAQAMRAKSQELPRGIPKAYTAIAARIGEALRAEARRGMWEPPSIEEMKQRVSESFARFNVGDTCLYFSNDDDVYGREVTIVGGLDTRRVRSDVGRFIGEHGPVEFLTGYVVQAEDFEPYFARPGQLTRDDCKPSHLRLVAGPDVSPVRQPCKSGARV